MEKEFLFAKCRRGELFDAMAGKIIAGIISRIKYD